MLVETLFRSLHDARAKLQADKRARRQPPAITSAAAAPARSPNLDQARSALCGDARRRQTAIVKWLNR
jgi:hypothetical protein